MILRGLAILALILLPMGASAAEPTPADQPPTTSANSPADNPSGLQPSNASSGSSSADSTTLQPAGGNGLGATNAATDDLAAPTGNNLQGTTNANEQIKALLASEADGGPQPTPETAANPWLDTLGIVAALLTLTGVGLWVRQQQLAQAYRRYGSPTDHR